MDPKSSTSDSLLGVELEASIINLVYETQHFGIHPRMFVDRGKC